jgi:CubicO group peptidase (beta-lactamase class C family)
MSSWRQFRCALLMTLAAIWSVPAVAQEKEKDSLCAWLAEQGPLYLKKTGGPGMTVGIIDHGKLRCAQGFGVLRKGTDTPVTIQTNFHMASSSKPFAAVAIVKLISEGRISLDAPVTRYLPNFRMADPRYKKITIRHLLNHTAGLPEVADYHWDKPERDDGALARYVASLKTWKLRSAPGSRFFYSNNSSEVLGAVIARVSGMPYEDFIATRLLQPTGMDRSSFIYTPGTPADQATGHVIDKSGNRVISTIYPFSRRHGPSSTLQSNVVDMARWIGQMMDTPTDAKPLILTQAGQKLLFTPLARDLAKDEPTRMSPRVRIGLSWFLLPYRGGLLISHPGADTGFASQVVFDPAKKVGIVMMTNADQDDPTSVTRPDGLPNMFGFELVAQVFDRMAKP